MTSGGRWQLGTANSKEGVLGLGPGSPALSRRREMSSRSWGEGKKRTRGDDKGAGYGVADLGRTHLH